MQTILSITHLKKQLYAFAHMELHEMSETIGTSTHVPIRFKDGTTGPTPVYPPYPTWLTRSFMDGSCEAYMSYLSYCMSRVLSNEHEIKLAKDGVVSKDHLPAEMYELTPKILFESVLVCAVFGHLPALRRALHKSAIGRVVSPAYRVEAHQTTLVNQAFQLACRHGNMHIVEYLLTECSTMLDVHCNNEGGFQEACEQKQTSIIQKLLQQTGKHAVDPAAVARTQNAVAVRAALAEYVPVETMLSVARAAWGCPTTTD